VPNGLPASNLRPFAAGDPRTIEAARKGGEARRATRDGRRRDALALRDIVTTAVTTYNRDQLGPLAGALAADIMARLLSGEIRLRSADVAPTVRALVDIVRLESGEATSTALVAHVDAADVAARVGALQRQARAALATVSLPAQATGDDGSPSAVHAVEETAPPEG
jgi:hypothetical protein